MFEGVTEGVSLGVAEGVSLGVAVGVVLGRGPVGVNGRAGPHISSVESIGSHVS